MTRLKQRLLKARSTVEHRIPKARPLVATAEGYARRMLNLHRWAAEDPRALSDRLELAIALSEPPVEPLLHPNSRTIRRCHREGSSRGVICSFATGSHIRLLSVAVPTFIEYGERHGWDVVLSTEEHLPDGRPASWGKLPLIRQLLDEYDLVWWIDADAIIVNYDLDIRGELQDEKDLYLVEHIFPWPNGSAVSAGVMLWRSSPWSKSFIDGLWATEDDVERYPWENAALLKALGYTVTPLFAHLRPTSDMTKVAYLSPVWNSVWSDPPEPDPKIHHHGGSVTFDDRRRFMLWDLARVRRGEPPRLLRPSHAQGSRQEHGYLTESLPSRSMSRDDIPLLLNDRGLLGVGAEVGVYAGEFSARILRNWQGRKLISIDPWIESDDYEDVSNVQQAEFELLWQTTSSRLRRFGERSEVWRMTSDEGAGRIAERSLDFVYIDARHDEESVRKDLDLWYPKVRPGGVLAGHDYLDGDLPEGRFGVKTAVDQFFSALGLRVHVTGEPSFPSWIVEVPAGSTNPTNSD